jgi:hypothetical protein
MNSSYRNQCVCLYRCLTFGNDIIRERIFACTWLNVECSASEDPDIISRMATGVQMFLS